MGRIYVSTFNEELSVWKGGGIRLALNIFTPVCALALLVMILPQLTSANVEIAPESYLHDRYSGVPGPFFEGEEQAVCDTRKDLINWIRPLEFVPGIESPSCELVLGRCKDPVRGDLLGYVYRGFSCPTGFTLNGCLNDYFCERSPIYPDQLRNAGLSENTVGEQCRGSEIVGHPINVATGNKVLEQVDISGSGPSSLSFIRTYNSGLSVLDNSNAAYWSFNLERRIKRTTHNTYDSVELSRGNGRAYFFALTSGLWRPDTDIPGTLIALTDPPGIQTGWRYETEQDTLEVYDATGKLISITDVMGNVKNITYGTYGQLDTISNNSGQYISITFQPRTSAFYNDPIDRLDTVTDNTGRVWKYTYDDNFNLITVLNPDTTVRQYLYEDVRFPYALTGVIDERGMRYATYAYDDQGRGTSTSLANNVERVDIDYGSGSVYRTVTNSLGVDSFYTTQLQLGLALVTDIVGPGCSSCGTGDTKFVYDGENRLTSKTEKGIATVYGNYDVKDNYGYKIIALGTPEQRRTDYTYDPRFNNKITSRVEVSVLTGSSKTTTYVYDDFANRTSMTVAGFRPDGAAVSRTTTYQYNGPLNQLSQIDGPRTDVTDITTLDYYANDATQGFNRGRLQRITGPAGIVLRDNILYTATGKTLSEDRPNGISLTYTYYAGNDRLETLTETSGGANRVTRWTYLATGEVETITQADGTALATTTRLVYDDARRLIGMVDQLGNHIDYVLDTEGNRTDEKVFDSADVLYKSVQQTFDIYNRLDTRTLVDEIIDYNFQPDGSLDNSVNAKNVSTDFQYDALQRLTTTTGDMGGVDADTQDTLTQYGYDAGDRLTSVTSPNNSNTTYSYDDLGNLLSETSPDRGTRNYTYDQAGNVSSITDARSITVSYSYDALNRATSIDYPGTTEESP